ncbi:MAG: TIGR01212 family radical SAM protein [Candidatus Omnitrophota bacterium]
MRKILNRSGQEIPYYSFGEYLREKFKKRVRRISINAGFGCPQISDNPEITPCIFCNEKAFSHYSGTKISIKEQIRETIEVFKERSKAEKFIAYFQNGTNTYADCETLKKTYDIIRLFPDIVGLFISTRPDCIDDKKLDLIESYADDYDVWIEYGMQTANDATLDKIERNHTFSDCLRAIRETQKRKIKIGVHIILGLPGETEIDIMKTAEIVAGLPISGIKFHVLHVLKNTKLQKLFENGKIKLLSRENYIKIVCDFLERQNPECVILRLVSNTNKGFLIAPDWINEKAKTIQMIEDEFKRRGTRQGDKYGK